MLWQSEGREGKNVWWFLQNANIIQPSTGLLLLWVCVMEKNKEWPLPGPVTGDCLAKAVGEIGKRKVIVCPH